jgi:hypothetical protein
MNIGTTEEMKMAMQLSVISRMEAAGGAVTCIMQGAHCEGGK